MRESILLLMPEKENATTSRSRLVRQREHFSRNLIVSVAGLRYQKLTK